MNLRALLLLLLCAGLHAGTARADTNCTASAPAVLDFGTITNGAATPADTTLAIRVSCSTGALSLLATASIRMCLSLGTGSAGTTLTPFRRMTVGGVAPVGTGDSLNYQLYTNAARSVVWGSTAAGTPGPVVLDLSYSVPLTTGTGAVTATVYARIPANQVLSAGTFSSSFSTTAVTLQYAYNEVLALSAPTPTSCTTPAGAGGATGNKTFTGQFPFTVQARVLPTCTAYTTTDMDFGSVAGAVAGNIDRTSTIGLTCINRTAYSVGLDNGSHASGSSRRMRHATNTSSFIGYELYRDSGRTLRWGNTLNVDTVPGTGTGSAQTLTVYGRALPTGTTLPSQGTYSDVVTVSITY